MTTATTINTHDRQRMETANLKEFSKSLELSHKEHSEEFIHEALRAHGFFQHGRPATKRRDKVVARCISEEDKTRTTQLISHFKEGREFHTLKEPRHLYGYTQSSPHDRVQVTLPFWPSEVECIRERGMHLMIPPKHTEPYYTVDSDLVSPKIRSGEGYGKVVYTNLPGPEKYFVKSRQGPCVNLPPAQTPSSADLSLEFESRFESGNLGKAVQVGRWDYELYLRYDLYTRKHTQWFYFRVRNMQAGQRYRFTIVNLYKAGSLYNEGMQPAFYSERLAKERRIGWHRAGHNIKYFKTPIKRLDTKQESFCYGVTWSHTFKHNGDTCYFAHSFPYTYSNLQDYLQKTLMNRNKAQFCKYKVLCRTIAGNSVPLLTITSPSPTPDDSQAKRGVVVTARIHPGETNGSWMMKGLLDFLTSSADDAKILRDLFVFKIVPMLNPDGVIVGNYRCSLTGRDLNRNYRSKLKDSYPTVWHTRNLVKQFCKEREVVLFCDLHGHSRKHNIFIYGCDTLNDASSRLKSRVFPRMLFKNAPDMFSYNSSRFVVQKSKEGTGRVVMWREAGIQNSYTLEATFAGSTQGKLRGVQFTTAHLEGMGYHLCDTLLDYCDPDQSKTERIMRELEEDYRKSVVAALAALGREVPPGVDPLDIEIDPALAESSDAGSDSSESDGPPVHVQWKRHHKTKKKKRLKSRRERNKQKALLKMNHHQQRAYSIPSPSLSQPTDTQSQTSKKSQPESKEEKRTEPVCAPQQSFDVLGSQASAHTYIYNGGIPTFVQDRLEERQRRREEEGASDALGGVPPEELRLALMHIQATHTQKTPSSTVFIPHPSCPMNISQINIHEASRRQSRLSSKVSLPKLDSATSGSLVPKELPPLFQATRSKGAFTSQYVAHHLQHIGANTTATENSINSTQNLSNLSRLFRQLHPKAYHTPHTEDDLQSLHFKPPPNTAYHGKVESNKQEQNDNHQLQNDKLREMDYLVPNETREEPREESVDAMNTTQTDGRPCSSGTQGARGGSDCSLSSSYSSYFNKGSGGSSPMTNSWKGFSQGVTYLKHKQETKKKIVTVRDQQEGRKKPTVVSRNKKQHGVVYTNSGEANRVLIDAQLAAEKGGEENYQRYVAKEQTGRRHYLEGHTEAVPTTLPQPRSCSPTKYIELPIDKTRTAAIKAHKQGIADAVEHAHTMQTHDKRSPANMQTPSSDSLPKLISKSRSDPLPHNNITSRLVTPLPNDHGHLQPRAHQRLEQQAVADFRTSVNKNGNDTMMGKGNRADKVKHKAIEYVRKGRSVEHMDNTVAYYDETTCTRPEATHADTMSPPYTTTEDEEAQLRRVYSSKPPSRYGPRPGPDDGVPPATVSIMLSGRLRSNSRPSTMHTSSRRHGKHAHIRYFTKKT